MCGITGFVTAGFGGDSRAVVHRMKAPPAYTLVVSPGATPQLARYWTSVRSRLGRDVPIGVFVSGGIDSGAVAARAARQTDAPPIQTFAVGFEARTRLRSENGMIRGIGVLALHQHVEWTH